MSSVLDHALDAVAAAIVSLGSPSPEGRAYERIETMEALAGTSGHRTFMFEVPTGAETVAIAQGYSLVDHELRMRVRLSSVGISLKVLPGWVASHGVSIKNRINRLVALGTGIRSIRAPRYDVVQLGDADPDTGEVLPSGDFDILVSLRVRAEEADR